MSSALAIASVTAVLRDLLDNWLAANNVTTAVGGNVTVSALPPDRIDTTALTPANQLNLFLYQATPNHGWRNQGLPTRDSNGERVSNPALGLDLHYMLTAYGADQLHAEILLGYGMQLFHETPVLTRDAVRNSLAALPAGLQSLAGSEVAEQVEQIKICPQVLSSEEISKLWTAFQSKYRPTAAYQASVVLIESRRAAKSALPVRARKLVVVPFQQPFIEAVLSQAQSGDPIVSDQPILAGHNLIIAGKQLRGEETRVKIGGIEVTPSHVDETQIVVALPAALRAGAQGVQVVHRILMGEPAAPHRGVESNLAAFVLRPVIVEPVSHANGTVEVTIKPAVGDTQRAVLLLNEFVPSPPSPPEPVALSAYSFTAPSRSPASPPGATGKITFKIHNVKPAQYLVRVQIDGAESPLLADAAGRYDSPRVTIP